MKNNIFAAVSLVFGLYIASVSLWLALKLFNQGTLSYLGAISFILSRLLVPTILFLVAYALVKKRFKSPNWVKIGLGVFILAHLPAYFLLRPFGLELSRYNIPSIVSFIIPIFIGIWIILQTQQYEFPSEDNHDRITTR